MAGAPGKVCVQILVKVNEPGPMVVITPCVSVEFTVVEEAVFDEDSELEVVEPPSAAGV
jgi:hypothetical protein